MCGIVAMIPKRAGGFYRSDVEMLQHLLVLDGQFRGLDSTGAFQVQSNRQAYVVKSATVPHLLFRTTQWDKFENRMVNSSKLIVGHNRKATVGEANSKNAHPFHEGNIILVHNGTLHNHKEFADATVDSHAIAKAFNENKAEEILPKIRGAFAFVWYDMQKERLFVIRNDERPLGFVETESMLYFASEPWMIEVLRRRMNNNSYVEKGEIVDIPPETLYEFNPFDGKYSSKKVELHKIGGNSQHFLTGNHRMNTTQQKQTLSVTKVGTTPGVRSIPGMNEDLSDDVPFDVTDCYPAKDCGTSKVINLYPDIRRKFKDNEEVMVRLLSADRRGSTNQWSVRGVVAHPSKPLVDIDGILHGVSPQNLSDYVGQIVLGAVDYITDHQGGPIVHLKNIDLPLNVNTWTESIPLQEWEHIAETCKCTSCGAKLDFNQATTTYIKRTEMGVDAKYYVECPDCVEKKLENGGVEGAMNEFKRRRGPAVQNGKPERKGTSKGTNAIVTVQGPATLQ